MRAPASVDRLIVVLSACLIFSSSLSFGVGNDKPEELRGSGGGEEPLDTFSPIILSTSPSHGQVVYPNVDVLIQFNESMNTSFFSYEFISGSDPGMTWTWETTVYENDTIRGTHVDLFGSPTLYEFNVTYAEDVSGNPLAPGPVPNPWNWTTIVVIISTDPADGERKVGPYRDIIINFSGPVDIASNITWMIFPDPGAWNHVWLVSDTVLVSSHSNPFEHCTWHMVGFYRDGFPFPSLVPNPWWFESWCPPRVIRTDPENGEMDVELDRDVRVWFSASMNTATVVFTIDPVLDVSVSWSENDTLLTISHDVPFPTCQVYIVQIVAGQDVDGYDLLPGPGGPVPNPWSFRTKCAPYIVLTDPADMEVMVPLDHPIYVWFNEPMNTTSVNWSIVPFIDLTPSWSLNDTQLTLDHVEPFTESTLYAVTIAQATDLDGNNLVPGPVPNPWCFNTVTCAPYIVSTDPYHDEVNVSLDRSIVVEFSHPMDPSTLVVDINPHINLTATWINGSYTLILTHGIDFEVTTKYTAQIWVMDIIGNPIIPGPVPNPWNWTTEPVSSPPPAPPTGIMAILSGPQLRDVTLSWQLSIDDHLGGSVSHYEVYRGTDFDGTGLSYPYLASVPSGTSFFVDQLAGQDEHNYLYVICAVSGENKSSCAERQASKFTRPLAQGPNLVSIPLVQFDESIETVLQTVSFDKAWYYDAFSKEWKWYMKFKGYRRGLWSIDHKMGLWINVTGPSNLTVAGVVPAQTAIHLYKGWNLIGYPSFNTSFTIADLKATLRVERVEAFDVSAPPYFLRVPQDSDVVLAGQAYWMEASQETIWIIST